MPQFVRQSAFESAENLFRQPLEPDSFCRWEIIPAKWNIQKIKMVHPRQTAMNHHYE
ncbi:MAG: hypothetical protein IKD85_01075 [Firmicutes bacterium]|nr:hypothetical protein [Bacillota bacterium]